MSAMTSAYGTGQPGSTTPNYQQAWVQQYQQGWGQDTMKGAASTDPSVSAAWAAYYQQYYGAQVAPTATTAATTGAATGTTAASGAAATAAAGATGAAVQPAINPQTGQADYSQAWIEYYRSMGLYEQADAILRQTQQVNNYFHPSNTN